MVKLGIEKEWYEEVL